MDKTAVVPWQQRKRDGTARDDQRAMEDEIRELRQAISAAPAATAQQDERDALQRAKDDQTAFEEWSKRGGGLNLRRADGAYCEDFRFPATYYYSNTETAWRAWANKPDRAALTAQDAQERDRIVESIVSDVCEMDRADPDLNDTICIDVSDLITIVKRHVAALTAPRDALERNLLHQALDAFAYVPVDGSDEYANNILPVVHAIKKHLTTAQPADHSNDAVEMVRPAHSKQPAQSAKFSLGDRVKKASGSQWHGKIVGTYSTALTPEGYAVESETEEGSVQIYPAKALERWDGGQAGDKLQVAIEFINKAPHGDNCFVSDHYEGDPGNRCNCGKDSLLSWLEDDSTPAQPQLSDEEIWAIAVSYGKVRELHGHFKEWAFTYSNLASFARALLSRQSGDKTGEVV